MASFFQHNRTINLFFEKYNADFFELEFFEVQLNSRTISLMQTQLLFAFC
jgi:D-lactate dehydrogenase